MKKLYTLVILALCLSNMALGQFKSLRELSLSSDAVAIVANNYPDPFLSNKKLPVTDSKSLLLVDSIRILSYLKHGKTNLAKRTLVIENSYNNSYFDSNIRKPKHPIRITFHENLKPPTEVTIFFTKEHRDYSEVLYDETISEEDIPRVKNFILWVDSLESEKNEAIKCRKYIDKYLTTFDAGVTPNLLFFENILLPSSNFMQYYKLKAQRATILTAEQKDRFKAFWEDEHYFNDVQAAELMYDFFPKETIDFFKNRFAKVETYDDDFNDKTHTYAEFLEFLLKKEKKMDLDTQFQLTVLSTYNDNIIDLKRDAFEMLVKKIPVE